ncbi:FIST C-terminal domain-containing protein [Clostridiaceae bacterium OttesenSCG-928-D20]|nr:FIST C-terminal domain-containing protein [Clostridiaceae bacterium OttesenSCG-928-D20]
MLNSYTLMTNVIDEKDIAVAELLEQYSKLSLRKNTIGIIICHPDYKASGIVSEISEKLPFPIHGYTTFAQACSKGTGIFSLSITVLTSDDISFSAEMTEDIISEVPVDAPIEKAYSRLKGSLQVQPKLIMGFVPTDLSRPGDQYIRAFNRLVDDSSAFMPLFATYPNDMALDVGKTYTIFDGSFYEHRFVMIGFAGNIEVCFEVAYFDLKNLSMGKKRITKSHSNIVSEIENQPVMRFIEENGFSEDLIDAVPFIVEDAKTGDKMCRVCAGYTAEYMHFVAEIPENSYINVGIWSKDTILSTAREKLENVKRFAGDKGVYFVFSCMNRYHELASTSDSEIDLVIDVFGKDITFAMGHAAGEISPFGYGRESRMHNNAMIICALK